MRLTLIAIAAALSAGVAAPAAVAVRDATAPDPDDKPLAIRIWHPDPLTNGRPHALIVISHGTGGSLAGHADTALALAGAGFVVVSVSHTGDNYLDQSYVGKGMHLVGRPRHISRVIDYMLTAWEERRALDAARIGMFGHSAGGFTALVLAGGDPDMSRGARHCADHPSAWDCGYLRQQGLDLANAPQFPPSAWHHDSRIKAAVIAAPAVGYVFEPNRLARVAIPVQLWVAGHDSVVDDSPATVRRLLPQPPDYRYIAGAGHLSFVTPCSRQEAAIAGAAAQRGALNWCTDPDAFDRVAFHRAFNDAVIAFFAKTLG